MDSLDIYDFIRDIKLNMGNEEMVVSFEGFIDGYATYIIQGIYSSRLSEVRLRFDPINPIGVNLLYHETLTNFLYIMKRRDGELAYSDYSVYCIERGLKFYPLASVDDLLRLELNKI